MAKLFVQDTTMAAIADAIREKAGITSALYPESMPSYIRAIKTASSDNSEIPEYVLTEGKRVASGMVSKRGANSLTAVIMSDMHEFGDNDNSDATIMERYRRANRNAGQGAKVVADNIDIDFFANLGDLAWGAKTSTVADFVQSIVNAKNYMYDVTKDHESFITPGNHDTATYGFAQNGEYLSQAVTDGLIGTYRYVDFTSKKVRVICLNTAEVEGLAVSGQSGTERITGTQLQWFANALDLSGKSDAASWGIIILSHHPLDWGSILPAANCLQAYLTGGNYSVTHNGVAVSKNFSGKNAAKVICQFHGHVHGFRVDNIRYGSVGSLQTMDVKRIAIPNACFARSNEYGDNTGVDSNGIEFGETDSYEKTDGTAKNTAFCLVSIDLDNEVIYADCYGAGYDRVISYAEEVIITYSITNNIPGAANSNGSTSVVAGQPYSASISALAGYKIESVSLTMGGVNASQYLNGYLISIPEVTGNIVITVTTSELEDFYYAEFTNYVLKAEERDSTAIYNNGLGYKNDVYLNEAGDASTSGIVSTGFIPFFWDPSTELYIKGATLDTSDDRVRIYGYANKTSVNSNVGYTYGSRITERFTVETLGDKYYKLTPKTTATGSLTHIRISLVGTGEKLKVAINEPIHQTCIVVYDLDNVSSSNNNTHIIRGSSYSTVLTAHEGCELESVSVYMYSPEYGELDITSQVYNNGVISIPEVGTQVIITAVAVGSATSYTNLVKTSEALDSTAVYNDGLGYRNGYYVSDKKDSVDADCVATGYIPYTWSPQNVIYIKGATLTDGVSHVRLYGFSAKGTVHSAGSESGYASGSNGIANYFTIETLGDMYYKLTPLNTMTSIKYLRISLLGTGENLVVTVNQEIESSGGGSTTPVQYSVTNSLTNVSSSNSTASVVAGSAYSATLTAASGYTLTGGTVRVTMGGVDITASAVSGSNINIANVTGNIEIMATAVLEQAGSAYTNLVHTSIDTNGGIYNATGYKEGYRLNSSGVPTELAGAVHSGFIPYNGEVIRVWGTTSANSGNSGNYIGLYGSDFAKIYMLTSLNAVNYGATWEAKDGKYLLTVDPAKLTNTAVKDYLASTKYIRASMVSCTGANFVITLGEQIE